MLIRLNEWLQFSNHRSTNANRRMKREPLIAEVAVLEKRVMLSAVTWVGHGDGTSWSDVKNWSTGSLPDSTSDVTLSAAAGTTIHGPAVATTINSLSITSAKLVVDGGALTISNQVTISSGQSLTVNAAISANGLTNAGTINVGAANTLSLNGSSFNNTGTLIGPGTIDLTGSTVDLGPSALTKSSPNLLISNATLQGSALTIATQGSLTANATIFNVSVTNQGSLTVMNTEVHGTTTFASTVTNQGTLTVINATQHAETLFQGLLKNNAKTTTAAAGSFLIADAGLGFDTDLNFNGGVINSGSMSLTLGTGQQNLHFANKPFVNDATGTFGINGVAKSKEGYIIDSGGLSDAQNPVFINNGALTVALGQTLGFNTQYLTNNGTITGTGTIDLTYSIVNYNSPITSATPNLTLIGTTFIGTNALVINGDVTQHLNFNATTFNVPLQNQAIMIVAGDPKQSNSVTFNYGLTNASGATIRFENLESIPLTVSLNGGLVNSGTIFMSPGKISSEIFNVANSPFINALGGVINVVDSAGVIVQNISGLASPTTPVFVNKATVSIDQGQTLTLASQYVTDTSTGTFTGKGTVDFSSANIDYEATITSATAKLNLANSNFEGSVPLTIGVTGSLLANNTAFNVPVVNQGTLVVDNAVASGQTTTFNNAVTNAPGASFQFLNVGSDPNGTGINLNGGFTNSGTLLLNSTAGMEKLNVANNPLVNVAADPKANFAGGVITVSGTTPVVIANVSGLASPTTPVFVNKAIVSIDQGQTLTLASQYVTDTSTGTFTGKGTVDFSSANIDYEATITSATAKLNLANSNFEGSVPLTIGVTGSLLANNTAFNVPVVNQGTLVVDNAVASGQTTTFNNAVTNAPGASFQFLNVGSDPNGTGINLNGGFTNSGTLLLNSTAGMEKLNVANNPLVNVAADPKANLVGGVITVSGTTPVVIANVSGLASPTTPVFVNKAIVSIDQGQTLTLASQYVTDTSTGTFTGKGTVDFSSANIEMKSLTLTTGSANLVLTNATLNGTNPLTIDTPYSLQISNTTFNLPVENRGTLNVAIDSSGNSSFNAPFSNAGAFQFQAGTNGNSSSVTVANGFTNSGTITLLDDTNGESLNVTAGSIFNSASGIINIQGKGSRIPSLNSALNNQGKINVNAPLSYSGSFTNAADVNIGTTQATNLLESMSQVGVYPEIGRVTFNGPGSAIAPQTIEAMSLDVGTQATGFLNNSVLQSLSLTNNTYVQIVDQTKNNPDSILSEAIYVHSLDVPAGTTLDLLQHNLYAGAINVKGIILNGTVTPALPFTSANSTTFVVGKTGSFRVAAIGSPDPTKLSVQGSLPTGVSFDRLTGILSGNPSVGGVFPLTFTASTGSVTSHQTFTLTVNQAPALTSINSTTFTAGIPGKFTLVATGFPAPTFAESGVLPTGVTLSTAGILTSTAATPTGTYKFTVTASNGVGTNATQSFTLSVDQAPSIISAKSVNFGVGSAGSFKFVAVGYPTPRFSETGVLPPGVVLSTAGVLTSTPLTPTGNYTFTVLATNDFGTDATQTFTLNVDQAPAITSAANTIFTAGTAGKFTMLATGFPAPTFTETGTLPSGVSLSSAGVLTSTPATPTGVYTFTVKASNGFGTAANQTFTLNVNQAPTITSAANTIFTAGTAGKFTVLAKGFPAPTFTESGTLPTGVSLSSTGVLTSTAATPTGVYTFTVKASNGFGTAATQTFTLNVDQAPAITSAANAIFTAGAAGRFTVLATGFPAPTFTETGTLPTGVSLSSAGVLTSTAATPTGAYKFTVKATNGFGTAATQTFTLNVNQAPAITSGANTIFTAGTAGKFTVLATGFPAPTFTVTGTLPTGVSLSSAGVLTSTAATPTGVYTFTVKASNGFGTAATQTFTLNVNQAPTITSGANTIFTAGAAGKFTVLAKGFPAPTFTETGTLPSGVSLSSTGVLTSTSATPTGVYTFTLKASNGFGTAATQTFTLKVDQAPAITSANSAIFTVGTPGKFTMIATGFPAPSFSETGTLPTGVSLSSTGVLTSTATTPVGSYTFKVTADNGFGTAATQTFTLTVNPAAPSKLVFKQTPPTTGTAGVAMSPTVTVAVEDAFGNVVTSNTSTVTLTVGANTFTAKASSGIATFAISKLSITLSGSYAWTTGDGNLTKAITGLTISPAAASKVVINLAPSAGTAGTVINTPLQLWIEDPYGNLVTTDKSTVTLSVLTGPIGAKFATSSTLIATAVGGKVSFTNLVLNTSGTYTFKATDSTSSIASAVTPNVTINPGIASKLVFLNVPGKGSLNAGLTSPVTVAVEDSFGNLISGNTSNVTLTIGSGPTGGTFSAGNSITTSAVNGTASFNGIKFTKAGTYTLKATDGSFTFAVSVNIVIS